MIHDANRIISDSIAAALADNDAYPLLREMDALLMTGPTGTNVCDVAVLLCR